MALMTGGGTVGGGSRRRRHDVVDLSRCGGS